MTRGLPAIDGPGGTGARDVGIRATVGSIDAHGLAGSCEERSGTSSFVVWTKVG
jgi:hypothetical protein